MLELLKKKNVQWAIVYFILGSLFNFTSFNTSSDTLNMLGNIVLQTLSIILIVVAIREFRNEGE